ncbi:MAG TPA: hypothetical protein VFY29_05410 [Terriglobia bacterium]|nr:hypothetical protein [Terriglobia bacterium]
MGEDLVMEAQAFISHCESCAPEAVDHLTFDYVLDAISDCDPRTTQYLMCRPAHCPHCSSPVSEKTLVVAR